MGGIAGIICTSPVAKESITEIVDRMLRSMLHRGPDKHGVAYAQYGALGANRLSVIDIRGGDQPYYHTEKPYIIVFNGEIYNYKALREKLEAKGVEFITRSDTEVLMMMYDYYDEDMFHYLEGMYSFAIWNGEKQELIIARDPLGQKPLYYEMDEHGIAFASEMKAIFQVRKTKPPLSENALQNYLALGYIPSPMTMFEGIFKLPPGYMLRWRIADQSLEVWPIWVPDDAVSQFMIQNKNITFEDSLAEMDRLFRHSVQQQVKASEVPVGVYLSGGMDSGLVAALAKQYADYPLQTFTAGYAEGSPRHDGRSRAHAISKALGTVHQEIQIGPEAIDQLPRILWHMDEPLADPMVLTFNALSAQANDYLKVVLTGTGADEIFGSALKYAQYEWMLHFAKIPAPLRMLLGLGTAGLTTAALGWEKSQLLQALFHNADPMASWQTCRNFSEQQRKKLLTLKECFPDKRFRVFSKGAFEPFVQLQWDDFHHWLPHNLLMNLDKSTMAHNVEARSPFLDHRLATWALALPRRMKWHGAQNKYLLREYAKQFLPKEIVRSNIIDPGPPLDAWLYPCFHALEASILGSALLNETNFFKKNRVEQILRAYEAGTLRSIQPVWNLLVLKTWYEVYTKYTTADDLWEIQLLGTSA